MKKPKIAVFIPAYNCAPLLPKVLDDIPQEILDMDDVWVVDDASDDYCNLMALGYEKERKTKKIRVSRNPRNLGYGLNQKQAYLKLLEEGFDVVALLHGDYQYNPKYLPELIKPILDDEADVVIGSRFLGDPLMGGMPLIKYVGNRFLTMIQNYALQWNRSEYHSGYRLYSRKALKSIPFELASDGFAFDAETLVQIKIAGLRVKDVPIETRYAGEKSHVRIFHYGYDVLRMIFQYGLHKRNIRRYEKFERKET